MREIDIVQEPPQGMNITFSYQDGATLNELAVGVNTVGGHINFHTYLDERYFLKKIVWRISLISSFNVNAFQYLTQ